MTAESPEGGFGNPILDRQIAAIVYKKFKERDTGVSANSEADTLFNTPRVEQIASASLSNLDTLLESMTNLELDEPHKESDILLNIYNADKFIFEYVLDEVYNLMQHTQQPVYMTDAETIGYSFCQSIPGKDDLDEDDEDADSKEDDSDVYFIIEDKQGSVRCKLETPHEIQDAWDSAPRNIRNDLREFSKYTKRDIISRFISYVKEYIEPHEDSDNQLQFGL